MGDIVWSEARETVVEVLAAADAEEAYQPDDGIHGTHAMFIGADLGLVVEGNLDDLERLARHVLATVVTARDAEAWRHVRCTGADDLCGAPAGTPCAPGCPSLASGTEGGS